MLNKSASEIIFTGGRCGGKSTVIEYVREALKNDGYYPLVIQEVATDFINLGLPLSDPKHMNEAIQAEIAHEVLHRRRRAQKFAGMLKDDGKDPVILFDRGIMDNEAYIGRKAYKGILQRENITHFEASWSFDCVIHLESLACQSAALYSKYKNSNFARFGSWGQAVAEDRAIRQAWVDHHHYRFVGDSDLEAKKSKAYEHVQHVLGDQEIERKILFEGPSAWIAARAVENADAYAHMDIDQIYFDEEQRTTRCKHYHTGEYSYLRSIKHGEGVQRYEQDNWVSKHNWDVDCSLARKDKSPIIRKTRTRFLEAGTLYEMDIFNHPKNMGALLEVELLHKDDEVVLPRSLNNIPHRDVTDEEEYKSYNIATKAAS